MPLAAATSSVKKQFRNARRRFGTAIIKYNFRLFARQQHRQHGFLDVQTVLRFVKDLVRVLLEQGGGDLLAPVGGQTVQHQRARLCVFQQTAGELKPTKSRRRCSLSAVPGAVVFHAAVATMSASRKPSAGSVVRWKALPYFWANISTSAAGR